MVLHKKKICKIEKIKVSKIIKKQWKIKQNKKNNGNFQNLFQNSAKYVKLWGNEKN